METEHVMERHTARSGEGSRRERYDAPPRERLTLMDEMLAGALGGLVGGIVMTAVMTMGKQTGMIDRPLPVRVERWAEERAGIDEKTSAQEEVVVGQGMHLLYSALLGASYGVLRSTLDAPAIPSGPLYGLGVYALNLGAVLPALDLTKGPLDEEPTTAGRRMMMHVAFGMATGLISEKVRERMMGTK